MSIQSEIDRISNAVGNAYLAVVEKGGKLPSDNLPEAIDSIFLEIPLDQMGDAESKDVALGKTFTSSNGLKIEGTYDKSAPLDPVEVYNETRPKDWFQMPDFQYDEEIQLLVNVPVDGSALLAFDVDCTGIYSVEVYDCLSTTELSPIHSIAYSQNINSIWTFNSSENTFTDKDTTYQWGENSFITSDGMRQVFIRISGTNITSWAPSTHPKKTNPSDYTYWNIVEIRAKLPNVNSFKCKNLRSLRYFSLRGENDITDANNMFMKCYSLVAIPSLDTSNVTDMSSMFNSCYSLTSIPSLDTSNVTDMSNIFYSCRSLTSVPSLDTSNVNNMTSMFNRCHSLIAIPALNTSKVTNMNNMFYLCNSLTSVPSLDTSNVTDMSSMFNSCYSLTSIPSLDTSKVTNMSSMFYICYSLPVIPALNTSKVTTMSSMFTYVYALSHVTLNPSVTDWPGVAIDMKECSLLHDAIIDLFNSLPTITTSKALTLTGNPGVSDLTDEEKAIATDKGWTLTL